MLASAPKSTNLLRQSKDIRDVLEDMRINLESYFKDRHSTISLDYIKSLLVEFRRKYRLMIEDWCALKRATAKTKEWYEDAMYRLMSLQYLE
jgi:hypothetical protein